MQCHHLHPQTGTFMSQTSAIVVAATNVTSSENSVKDMSHKDISKVVPTCDKKPVEAKILLPKNTEMSPKNFPQRSDMKETVNGRKNIWT